MIKVQSHYDREKISSLAKKTQNKTLIVSILLSLVLFALGVVNVYSAINNADGVQIFSLIVGIIVSLFSLYPIISVIKTGKNSIERAVIEMNVENSPILIEYVFKEKRIEIAVTKDGSTKLDTIMMKNVAKIRNSKEGVAIYLGNGSMYYILNNEFVEGDKEKLISLFKHNNILVK